MGMVTTMYQVSPDNGRQLIGDPPLIWRLIEPGDPRPYEDARRRTMGGGFANFFRKTPEAPPLVLSAGEGLLLDMDKAWHGVHVLLTGETDETGLPGGFVMSGGTAIGSEEVGYGPPRLLEPSQVAQVATFLALETPDTMAARFSSQRFREDKIYPPIDWTDDELPWLLECAQELKEKVVAVASSGNCLVILLT